MHTIFAPLINANDENILIVEWFHSKGAYIHKGETIALLETVKSTLELQADASGYITPLATAGQQVPIGQAIAALTDLPDEVVQDFKGNNQAQDLGHTSTLKPLRWTKKAELLAAKYNINRETFTPIDPQTTTITEADVRAAAEPEKSSYSNNMLEGITPEPQSLTKQRIINHSERILILGGGNIAVLVLDILSRLPNQHAVGILDDNADLHGKSILDCPILGDIHSIGKLWHTGLFDSAILAIGVSQTRAKLFLELTEKGIPLTNIIDPSSLILTEVEMGTGNLIMSFCRIGPQTIIGNNNFLSAYINLEHHNVLGDHCTFGPSVYTSGGVKIGSNVQFGTGIFIEPRLTIGDNVTIASGIILTTNVPPNTIVKNKPNFTFHTK